MLLPFAPRTDATHGGSRALAHLLQEIARRHDVALVYMRAPDEAPIQDDLRQRLYVAAEVLRPGIPTTAGQRWLRRGRLIAGLLRGRPMWATDWYVREVGSRLREVVGAWQPEIVHVMYHIMGQYLPALGRYSAPRVLTEIEPGADAARNAFGATPGLTQLLACADAWAWQRFEGTVLRQVDTAVVLTERDRQALAPLAGKTPIMRIPLGVTLPATPLNPAGELPPSLLFIGNYAHPPNVEAAIRLMRNIFPRLRERVRGLVLNVVGDQPTAEMQHVTDARIQITGRVSDVTPFLDRAVLVVLPLRLGGGMRVKALEALAAGKAVVASPLAVMGLEGLVDGEHVVLAESDDEFVDAIVQLLAEPARRARIARAARDWAARHVNWDSVAAVYDEVYAGLLARERQRR
jgi:glycosyltransferase involved in cell wall biosynthesis